MSKLEKMVIDEIEDTKRKTTCCGGRTFIRLYVDRTWVNVLVHEDGCEYSTSMIEVLK